MSLTKQKLRNDKSENEILKQIEKEYSNIGNTLEEDTQLELNRYKEQLQTKINNNEQEINTNNLIKQLIDEIYETQHHLNEMQDQIISVVK